MRCFVSDIALLFHQPNCYSRVISVDGQKKIIIFASRRLVTQGSRDCLGIRCFRIPVPGTDLTLYVSDSSAAPVFYE